MKQDLKTVDFSIIRYANCWEDANVLQEALNIKAGEKVLSIASAGDNSFMLLKNSPELVVAADVNATQLYLVELKALAIKYLEHQEFLEFVGFSNSTNRINILEKFKSELSVEARTYWESNELSIKNGIIFCGKFEKYFQYFAKNILPLIHSKKKIKLLMSHKNEIEQIDVYTNKWNTWRWRLFFKLFFSKIVMGKFGRDPQFLKEVKMPVSEFIFKKAAQHLSSTACQQNFILNFNLCGDFGSHLPDYVKPENYDLIKNNLGALKLFCGYAQDAGKVYGNFNKMNLSNIFEYMNKDVFIETSNSLLTILKSGGRVAYWNLMVNRKFSEGRPELKYLNSLSTQLLKIDKGFFYSKFIVEEKL